MISMIETSLGSANTPEAVGSRNSSCPGTVAHKCLRMTTAVARAMDKTATTPIIHRRPKRKYVLCIAPALSAHDGLSLPNLP